MLNREACERRVYRLATLLTGNPVAATQVIAQVVDVQPDLTHLDGAHMDRLTVLRSREIPAAVLADDAVPRGIAEVMASLPLQQREAWVFGRVYRLDEREMARAMDCSVTATKRHLEQADHAMTSRLGAAAGAAGEAVLRYSMSLDVPTFYRASKERRRRIRLAILVSGTVLIVLAGIVSAMWLLHHAGSGG